jgi:hypothetical protein
MIVNRNHFISPHAREGLISLTAITFIEEHALLSAAQIDDAKKSLQALFLRASGEETMLRKLIEMLRATRQIQNSFASISGTLAGVSKCIVVLEQKLADLRAQLVREPVSPETNTAFIGPFLSFSQEFIQNTILFRESLAGYLAAREQEARAQSAHRIAVDARERLRRRLAGQLAEARDEAETRIKEELVTTFDYGEAERALDEARLASRAMERAVRDHLEDVQSMCRRAMNPALRDRIAVLDVDTDIFTRFADALPTHPPLETFRSTILELFKLYQHSHGMFQLDFQKLSHALETMIDNPEMYFEAKQEDQDLSHKRDMLRKIEGLIPFLERAARLAADPEMDAYSAFSRELSATISERRTLWNHISEDLLRAKVEAEAEISTRL